MEATSIKPTDLQTMIAVRDYPQVIKYMGSKAKIIDFVVEGIKHAYDGGPVCDLFAGAGSLAGAIGGSADFISNDIQAYSGIIAESYLGRISPQLDEDAVQSLVNEAEEHVRRLIRTLPEGLEYLETDSLVEFNAIESKNRALLENTPPEEYNLFTRCYSGTWWSAIQCCWIDALKKAIDRRKLDGSFSQQDYSLTMTALMHAMAYSSQGTGHFAQYRDAKTMSSMQDIQIYRRKMVDHLFLRKINSLIEWKRSTENSQTSYAITTGSYESCLATLKEGTVYADPPYAFVHYSRFYHALETLVLYDHPSLQIKGGQIVKGRYREERHQSPFSIRTQVPAAFFRMFQGAKKSGSNLVLSYSDTGLFALEELCKLATETMGATYKVSVENADHKHMTMGRAKDRDRAVREALIIARKIK